MAYLPPPGQMINIGSHRLHLYGLGGGSPVVVMDAGSGDNLLTWYPVQSEIAKFTQVVSYDRSGIGWSERGSKPRSTALVVEELHALLIAAGLPAPYVLVGHSMGGVHVRMFAQAYPDLVAGLVLVDSSHEQQAVRFSQIFPGYTEMMSGYARRVREWNGRTHEEILDHLWGSDLLPLCPSPEMEAQMRDRMNPEQMGAIADEYESMDDTFNQPDDAIHSLGDLPMIVLTSTRTFTFDGLSEEQSAEMFRMFQECQTEISRRSTQGRQFIVAESGHYIQVDQPQIVIDAVREIVGMVRGAGNA